MDKKVYSQEEMSTILERVAELQTQKDRNNHQTGLTLLEMESVAEEAGLDARLVRQAVSELETGNKSETEKTSDSDATHIFENRWIDGDLDAEAWEDLVFELKHRFDSQTGKSLGMPGYGVGTVDRIGNSREWSHTSISGVETKILVRSRNGSTRINASQKVGLASKITESIMYGSILTILVTLVSAAATESVVLTTLITLLTLMSSITLIYFADKAWRNKKHNQLRELTDTVVTMLTANRVSVPNSREAERTVQDSAPRHTSNTLLEEIESFDSSVESPVDSTKRADRNRE